MEHLSLEIFDLDGKGGSQYAFLSEDTSITVTDTSEVFAKGDVWTYSFTLNIPANAHIFGTSGEIHGSRLHDLIDRRRARLWGEGLPLYLGYLRLGSEAEVDADGNVDVSLESGQKTFEDMIDGAKANQVPMIGDVQIGMALWRKRWTRFTVKLVASMDSPIWPSATLSGPVTHGGSDEFTFAYDGEDEGNSVQQYPRMVFPKGRFDDTSGGEAWDEDCINTDLPYTEDDNGTPTNPYCNVALCYQKYGYDRKDNDGNVKPDYSSEPEAQRGYEYMPADRVNSAPNFFVIYWIRALMHHLGIHVDENQMKDVEDMRRLFIVNTDCAYEEPKDLKGTNMTRYGKYSHHDRQELGRLVPEYIDPKRNISLDESGFAGINVRVESGLPASNVSVKISEVKDWSDADKDEYVARNSFFHKAFATSDCFPDVEISAVIKAIEDGFGVRFLFSEDYKRVRIVLVKNILRGMEVQDVACDILSDGKVENGIRGFRMTYGNTEDTHFFYKGFDDKLPRKKPVFVDDSDKHDYSHWDLNAEYARIINKVSAFDLTCYVTPLTGNAYGIKIDKDAKRYDQLHPSLFEFAGFMDAVDGDCTGEEETIETISLGFVPAIMNDLNMEAERDGNHQQRFALFVDETMRPRRPDLKDGKDYDDPETVYDPDRLYAKNSPAATMEAGGIVKPGEFAIMSDMYATATGAHAHLEGGIGWISPLQEDIDFDIDGHIFEGYRLYLQDNFEPNDNGVSPIETHDWGLMLGIMRGSGGDAYVNYTNDPDDGEGNDTWDIVPGSSVTSHPDTCDSYGNEWDYDGSFTITPAEAPARLTEMFPDSDAPFNDATLGYITNTTWIYVSDGSGRSHKVLMATEYSKAGITVTGSGDIRYFVTLTLEQLMAVSRAGRHMVVETDGSDERGSTLVQLCKLAYGGGTQPMTIDNGVGSRYGRFSLKLRADKLNPYFDPTQAEGSYNRRYLPITNENLRGRGIIDQFYKEYSYWVRNARIWRGEVRMELAQLIAIDKTKKVRVGDVTGFIRKMQYSISNRDGLGNVTMEIMYI